MDKFLDPQLVFPVLAALITAVGAYLVIIKKTRAELAMQTRVALEAFQTSISASEISDRAAFRTEQRAELQELRQKIRGYEQENAGMVAKLADARANIIILEARVRVLEQES